MISFHCLLARRKRHWVSYETWKSDDQIHPWMTSVDLLTSAEMKQECLQPYFSLLPMLTYFNVLHSPEERCSGLSLTSWCPVVFLIHSGFWCQRPAGQNGGQEEHLHRNALLDGPGGHCLWWKPWCHLRLQGTQTSIVVLLCTSLQM